MKNIKKIFRLIAFSSFALALFSVHDSTLSWFVKNVDVDNGASAQSAGAYFAGGDGTKETPYLLTNQRHFYNLAWLQYLGYFNQDEDNDGKIDKQYYFRLSNDIDCKSLVIPPIGTTKYPFLGSFDGENYTISNFKISDTYSELVSHPSAIDEDGNDYHSSASATINYCSIIGTFGVIGSYDSYPADTFYETSIPSLSNLYLDDVTISTKTSQVLVGAIAGYVNATIDNCGVHYVTFKIAENTSKLSSFSNVSDFALIGSYNKEKYSWDGDTESGDTGYGTSTDIKALHESLIENNLNDGNTGNIPKKYAIPFRSENSNLIQGTDSQVSINAYVSSITKKYTVNPSNYWTYKASTKGNNIGYYSGEIKTYEKAISYKKENFDTSTNATTPPDDVLEYLQNNNTHLLRLNTGASSSDVRYLLNSEDKITYIESAQVGDKTCNLLIPANGIWVAPKKSGKFRFVYVNRQYKQGSTKLEDAIGILFMRLRRVTPGDYSSAFDSYQSAGNGFYSNAEYGYFECEADTNYEYFITYYKEDTSSQADAPYIAYMDIGDNGTDSDTRTSITNFDFVTKENDTLTKIKNYDSASDTYVENSSYTKSNVTFKIGETTKETLLAFRRLVESSGGVLYYQSYEILSSSSTGTKTSTKDEKCEKVS